MGMLGSTGFASCGRYDDAGARTLQRSAVGLQSCVPRYADTIGCLSSTPLIVPKWAIAPARHRLRLTTKVARAAAKNVELSTTDRSGRPRSIRLAPRFLV